MVVGLSGPAWLSSEVKEKNNRDSEDNSFTTEIYLPRSFSFKEFYKDKSMVVDIVRQQNSSTFMYFIFRDFGLLPCLLRFDLYPITNNLATQVVQKLQLKINYECQL